MAKIDFGPVRDGRYVVGDVVELPYGSGTTLIGLLVRADSRSMVLENPGVATRGSKTHIGGTVTYSFGNQLEREVL